MSAAIIESAILPAEHPETQASRKAGSSKNKFFEKQILRKKEQGTSLALTIVSTLFPRKFGFDF
jgi:hypothetical protein